MVDKHEVRVRVKFSVSVRVRVRVRVRGRVGGVYIYEGLDIYAP